MPEPTNDDVSQLRRALAAVAERARSQPWADTRPWTPETHVWAETAHPVVDLHDLKAGLARRALDAVVDVLPELDSSTVCFVTGRGRHSTGPGVLHQAIPRQLGGICRTREGWAWWPGPAGRSILSREPADQSMGWGLRILLALMAAAALWACLGLR